MQNLQPKFETLLTSPNTIKPQIFKANDIRGIVGSEIDEGVYFLLGLSFATEMREANIAKVVVGRDGRLSSPSLTEALITGLKFGGVDVIDIGLVPSPVLYFATFLLQTGTGIIVTGSHNPSNYNGMKMMLGGKTLSSDDIVALKMRIEQRSFSRGRGTVVERELLPTYMEAITSNVKIKRRLKVVIDCGHGAASVVAETLFNALGIDVIPMYCEVDGRFPAHHPDPSKPENVKDLIDKVLETKADCGLAFDGDGDRLGVITSKGQIIWPDRQLMLYADQVLRHDHGASIIYDVKCTQHLAPWIEARGGKPVMYKTGHALIKSKMQSMSAPLAGEMSGHFFFNDRWYGFDDALYTGARLLEILASTDGDSSEIFDLLPNSVNTPEIQINMADEEKFLFIEKLIQNNPFSDATLITIDGLRVEWDHGWGLVRASNTSPCLVLRFESNTEQGLEVIKARFRTVLHKLNPELQLLF